MPFTFSHPAIILPLSYLPKKWYSLTGLVIGSLMPDFEYFIRMRIQSDYSHTILGLFWFNIPLGVLVAFIFHNIVRDSLFDNLPRILKSRLSIFKNFKWNQYFRKNWLIVVISIFIGAASHIFWDSFTHHHGYFVESIPVLTNTVCVFNFKFTIFQILQHSSTLIGGIIIIFALLKLPIDKNTNAPINIKYWMTLLAIIWIIISLRLSFGLDYKLYGQLIVVVISAGLISLILTSILFRKENANQEI